MVLGKDEDVEPQAGESKVMEFMLLMPTNNPMNNSNRGGIMLVAEDLRMEEDLAVMLMAGPVND